MLNNLACCFCGAIVDRSERDALRLTFDSPWIHRDLGGDEETRFAHWACVKTKLEPLLTAPLDDEIFPLS